jgi:hypothetical protein
VSEALSNFFVALGNAADRKCNEVTCSRTRTLIHTRRPLLVPPPPPPPPTHPTITRIVATFGNAGSGPQQFAQAAHRSKACQQLVKHVSRTALGNAGSRAEQFAQVAHNVFVVGFVGAACVPVTYFST